MQRRIISIAFLVLLIVSGSGISYLFSMQLARTNARKFESEILQEANTLESISMSIDAFHALPKEKISSSIFEITYQNKRFDIYKTETKGNTVYLFAKQDKHEEFILKNFAAAHSSKKSDQRTIPFYAFHFFITEKINFNSEQNKNIYPAITCIADHLNFSFVPSPPPDIEFA